MTRKFMLMMAVLAMAVTVAGAASTDLWLHIRVEEGGERGEKVKVNLPLSMLEKIAGAINLDEIAGRHFHGGRIRIDDADFDQIDLRQMWNAVKEADDMEFVSVESADENVRVAKADGYLLVKVRSGRDRDDDDSSGVFNSRDRDDRDRDRGRGEKVDVKVPLAVVDALLSAGEKEFDLQAALSALAEHGEGDLVLVQDGSTSVRIWIDDRNSMDD